MKRVISILLLLGLLAGFLLLPAFAYTRADALNSLELFFGTNAGYEPDGYLPIRRACEYGSYEEACTIFASGSAEEPAETFSQKWGAIHDHFLQGRKNSPAFGFFGK